MKKNAFIFLMVACTITFFSSCDKDDDPATEQNDSGTTSSLSFNGTEFIPNSSCELWHDNTLDKFTMHLWDGSLNLSSDNKIKGEGDWLELELFTQGSTPAGSYTLNYSEDEGSFTAYIQLGVYQNSNGYTSNKSYVEFTSGTAKIENTNDPHTFKVTIDLIGENNETFKGTATVDFRYIMQVY